MSYDQYIALIAFRFSPFEWVSEVFLAAIWQRTLLLAAQFWAELIR
jgi:hypothetical protein